jgi:hypothetical protein
MKLRALSFSLIVLTLLLPLTVAGAPSATKITLSDKPSSSDWTVLSPAWSFVKGKLDGSGLSSVSPKIVSTASFPSDRTFSVNFKTVVQGSVDYYSAWLAGKYVTEFNRTVVILHNSGVLEIAVSSIGTTGLIDHIYSTPTSLSNLVAHSLTVVYTGNTAQVSIDGTIYLTVTDGIIGALGACHVELASWGNSESQFSGTTITF